MPYATLDELRAWMSITDTADDNDLARALDAASDSIDKACGRRFSLDTADVTKVYEPNSRGRVDVVDLVTVTSIKLDTNGNRGYATTLTTADYELLPRNEGRYQEIRIWPRSTRAFTPGQLVQVVGKFGYYDAASAAAVRQACLILATRLAKRDDAPFGVLQSADIGTFERLSAEDPDVARLLRPYRRTSEWVLV